MDTKRIARGSIVIGTVVLLLAAAACGGDGDSDAADGGTSVATGATAETGSTGDDTDRYGGGGDEGGGGQDEGAGASTVQANNFAFDPTELEIAPGEDLTLKNGNANTPHTFTID
ncbi:MAG TPA: hypothetical protein VEC15_08315, partial [Actinomycetota bacterium]|nr:hypothetical protein [Actinomycetota bacterium]